MAHLLRTNASSHRSRFLGGGGGAGTLWPWDDDIRIHIGMCENTKGMLDSIVVVYCVQYVIAIGNAMSSVL